ncbi:voltage-gated potassium channel subunit beta-3 isoform X2 [Melopsittacus undulatus]|uniref:NADP-dependent oxidoreductase domain-containing protein n=1 Tax=Melopsittacus undulatus TaxID=13146 RepID=A0A8V5HB61_MELUD|nr:voltage-gated potassium channel subunit beta-3 isoform X2 [Melopsittacus undulatus]
MKYRTLGRSGLRVSCIGLGIQGTFGAGISDEVLTAAYDSGVTLYDVTEASGRAEKMLGEVLRSKGWRRSSYVITTRVFWGGQADRSLSRKQVLEELVRVMSDVIDRGLALYWGTAGGAPNDVMDTFAVARQFNLVAPVCQWAELPPEPRLFRQLGLGAVTWSPLAPGPALQEEQLPHGRPIGKAMGHRKPLNPADLQPLAQRLGCSVSQLGIGPAQPQPHSPTGARPPAGGSGASIGPAPHLPLAASRMSPAPPHPIPAPRPAPPANGVAGGRGLPSSCSPSPSRGRGHVTIEQ